MTNNLPDEIILYHQLFAKRRMVRAKNTVTMHVQQKRPEIGYLQFSILDNFYALTILGLVEQFEI